jgi:hypothetical protein
MVHLVWQVQEAMPLVEDIGAIPARTATVTVLLRPDVRRTASWSQGAAGPLSYLIRHLALAAGVLGLWRLGSDIGWTQDFFITAGFWSHWQTWLALAAALNGGANLMQRAARRSESQ